jgi:hypothetical protein
MIVVIPISSVYIDKECNLTACENPIVSNNWNTNKYIQLVIHTPLTVINDVLYVACAAVKHKQMPRKCWILACSSQSLSMNNDSSASRTLVSRESSFMFRHSHDVTLMT